MDKTQLKKKRLRKEADRLCYEICMLNNPLCEVCRDKAIQSHHFYPKGLYGHLRFDWRYNLIGLCMGCHFTHHQKSDPSIHNTIIAKRGIRWYNKLKKKAISRTIGSYQTIEYYENTVKGLKRDLKRLLKQNG